MAGSLTKKQQDQMRMALRALTQQGPTGSIPWQGEQVPLPSGFDSALAGVSQSPFPARPLSMGQPNNLMLTAQQPFSAMTQNPLPLQSGSPSKPATIPMEARASLGALPMQNFQPSGFPSSAPLSYGPVREDEQNKDANQRFRQFMQSFAKRGGR